MELELYYVAANIWCTDQVQLGESNSCFPWAYGAQCFFAVGRFGQSLLLFLFELAAGCMFVLKLSEQIENQLIGLKTS